MGQSGTRNAAPDVRFHRLINDAVAKDPNNPLAISVDTNLPPERAQHFYALRSRNPISPSKAMTALMDKVRKDYKGVDPYMCLCFPITLSTTQTMVALRQANIGPESSRRTPA